MEQRDLLIENKITDLKAKQLIAEQELEGLPKYSTNLRIGDTSLRTISTKAGLLNAFSDIYNEHRCFEVFTEKFGDVENYRIYGYTYDEWMHDFEILVKRIYLNDRLAKIKDAIKNLDKFYSADKRTTDAFNVLLGDIDSL